MARHVWPGQPARYGVEASPAKVVHTVEVWTEQGYGPRKQVHELLGEIADAMAEIAKDGISEESIKVSLTYDHDSGGYDGCDVTPKVVLHGERPATEAEVQEDEDRRERERRQAKANEVLRLRRALAAAERGARMDPWP